MIKGLWRERWRVIRELTAGGQGYAFLVEATACDKDHSRCVLKLLKDQSTMERRSRALQEVTSLKVLQHPSVAEYVESNAESFRDDVELFLVTKFVEGCDATELIHEKALPLSQAVTATLSVLETLQYCHSNNVIHRDIKPSNVIFNRRDPSQPVLIDFGLSFSSHTRPGDFATDTGQHLGNRFIYLPEYHTSGADKRNDVSDLTQCVGLFFYLITGIAPESLTDESGKKPHERSKSLSILSTLPAVQQRQLSRIFSIAFTPEIERRWQSISVLKTELLALGVEGASAPPPFGERLNALRASIQASPEHSRRRKTEELFQLTSKAVNATAGEVQKAFDNELSFGFGSWSTDVEKGELRISGQMAHRHFSGASGLVTVRGDVQGNELRIALKFNDKIYPGNLMALFDPEPQATVKKCIEKAFAELLEEWVPQLR